MREHDPKIQFFHSFHDPDIRGLVPYEVLKPRADRIFDGRVQGRSVLDIGAWDGFFSFEAETRGAASVLATDHFCWSGPGWGTKDGFDLVHESRKSRVQSRDIAVADLSQDKVGTHDLVLFLGVLYHLKDPLVGLERAASVCHGQLVVETAGALYEVPDPAMRFYLGAELGGDGTNFFAPNKPCLTNMLREVGFSTVEYLEPDGPGRLLAVATR
jgi:tRNA (mo5U34)-methyltransferase